MKVHLKQIFCVMILLIFSINLCVYANPDRMVAESTSVDSVDRKEDILARATVGIGEKALPCGNIYINGKHIDTGDTIMVTQKITWFPLRTILEGLGASVEWRAETEEVYFEYDGEAYRGFFNISTNRVLSSKKEYLYIINRQSGMALVLTSMTFSGCFAFINDRIYISSTELFEQLGCTVEVDEETMDVSIQKEGVPGKGHLTLNVTEDLNFDTIKGREAEMLSNVQRRYGITLPSEVVFLNVCVSYDVTAESHRESVTCFCGEIKLSPEQLDIVLKSIPYKMKETNILSDDEINTDDRKMDIYLWNDTFEWLKISNLEQTSWYGYEEEASASGESFSVKDILVVPEPDGNFTMYLLEVGV